MCLICSAVRPYDPDCPYTGDAAYLAAAERAEAAERLRGLEELNLEIDDAEFLFGNAQPPLPFDPFEDIGQPENDPTAFGSGRDIPSGTGTWARLEPGMRLNAEIGTTSDTDWFRMDLVEGQSYEISLSALKVDGLGDPKLFLFDNFGRLLDENDNRFTLPGEDGAQDSLLAFTATRTGVYFAGATGFGGGGTTTGGYQIALSAVDYDADTVGNIPSLAAPMQVNSPVFGRIDYVDDSDWYAITLEAGKTYYAVLDATVATGTPLGDPLVRVRNSSLSVIAENDDNGITRNAFIAFDITTTGTYYIEAAGVRSATGAFRLNVVELPPPPVPDPLKGVDWGNTLADASVTYYFAAAGENVMGEVTDSDWTPYEKAQATAALNEFSRIAMLTFTEVGTRAQADFVLGKGFLDSDLTGKMGPPDPDLGDRQGNGWFNTNPTYWSDATGGLLAPGAYGYSNFIHEFGHGLGLAHPHDDGGGTGQLFQGVRRPTDTGDFDLNQEVFTVMSYNKGWETGPAGDSGTLLHGIAKTPMALDIAVIQAKYGANMSWATGNDSYTLVAANGPGTGYTAIWDAGGADAIRHDGAAPAVIDLRVATLRYEEGGGGFVSHVQGIFGGFTIANGVVIENAIGGSGGDTINGNAVANLLRGRGGNDRIDGLGGNDTLQGGDGADTLIGGAGNDLIRGGDTAADLRDVVFGGDGNDTVHGGAGNDEASGGNGDDLIFGDAGSDTLIGNAGNDTLSGGGLSDVIFGGPGNDYINGGFGFDRLNGGAGADTFFHLGVADHGSDWIQDYAAAGGDVLAVGIAGAVRSQFQVNVANTPSAGAAGVSEAFVIYRPTGQILFALVDGDGQSSINLQIGGQVFDLLA